MVDLTVENGIAWLTLNRPKVLNVLDLKSVRRPLNKIVRFAYKEAMARRPKETG